MNKYLLVVLGSACIGAGTHASSLAEPEHAIPPAYQYPPPPDSMSGQSSGSSGSSGTSADSRSAPRGQSLSDRLPPPVPMTQLAPINENGITYLCGGVGDEEARQMKIEAERYDLMLTFSRRNGSYLADVNVDIGDAAGNSLLQTSCGGPIMLLDFSDSGAYKVRAEADGRTVVGNATVQADSGKHEAIVLMWPTQK